MTGLGRNAMHRNDMVHTIVEALLKHASGKRGSLDAYRFAGAVIDELAAGNYLRTPDERARAGRGKAHTGTDTTP